MHIPAPDSGQASRPSVSFADLMSKVGYFLFYWSTLEQALTEAILNPRMAAESSTRVSGTFNERLDLWSDLVRQVPGNRAAGAVALQVREQALGLRKIRNTIVHGLNGGRSMPDTGLAQIVCAVGGYDRPTGETVAYSIDDLEHFVQAADACRRGFHCLGAFNFALDSRFRSA